MLMMVPHHGEKRHVVTNYARQREIHTHCNAATYFDQAKCQPQRARRRKTKKMQGSTYTRLIPVNIINSRRGKKCNSCLSCVSIDTQAARYRIAGTILQYHVQDRYLIWCQVLCNCKNPPSFSRHARICFLFLLLMD